MIGRITGWLADRKIVRIKQPHPREAGAACLASVAEFHGRRVRYAGFASAPPASRWTTNALGLVDSAAALGFTAKAVRLDMAQLRGMMLPAIADVTPPSDDDGSAAEFVVIYRVDARRVTVMDPADGRVHRLTPAAFSARWSGVVVIMQPTERLEPLAAGGSALQRFARLVRPHWAMGAQALAGAVAYSVLGLLTAIYVQMVVDNVIADGNRNLLNLLSIAMIVALGLQIFINAMRKLVVLQLGQRIDGTLVLGYYRHLLQLPQRFFDTTRVGDLIARFSDAVKIRRFINTIALEIVTSALIVFLSVVLVFAYSRTLAMLVMALLAAYALIYSITNRFNRVGQRTLAERAADLESQLFESIQAASTVKRLALEAHAGRQAEVRFTRLLRAFARSHKTTIAADGAAELATRFFTIFVLWFGASFVLDGTLTTGELLSCYALLAMLSAPVHLLIGANQASQDALIAADRLFQMLDVEAEVEHSTVLLTADMVGDVRLDRVTFGYNPITPVFTELSLTIPKGQIVAIVGESGSGKSTLVALLQKLYLPEHGTISIGGYDLRYLGNQGLRRLVGVVPQKTELFSGTVLENVAVGEVQPDMRRVLDVCNALGVTEFVEQMPHGFHTLLSRDGANLSGGQRQRLAIARALYRDPQILLLDEATSALDAISEQHVQSAMQAFRRRGRTLIVIAHRLNTIAIADKIVVLEHGHIIEEGAHHELVQREGPYYRLFGHQLLGGDYRMPAARHQLHVPA